MHFVFFFGGGQHWTLKTLSYRFGHYKLLEIIKLSQTFKNKKYLYLPIKIFVVKLPPKTLSYSFVHKAKMLATGMKVLKLSFNYFWEIYAIQTFFTVKILLTKVKLIQQHSMFRYSPMLFVSLHDITKLWIK